MIRHRDARNAGPRAVVALIVLALLGGVVASCTSDDRSQADGSTLRAGAYPPPEGPGAEEPLTSVDDADVRFTRIASTGTRATTLISDAKRHVLFVGLQDGRIMRIRLIQVGGQLVPKLDPEPALDLSGEVTSGPEQGLFSLLLLPTGDRVVVAYSDLSGKVVLRMLSLTNGKLGADLDDDILVSIDHPYPGHNGGGLALTKTGDLLLSMGDMGLSQSDPPVSQDLTNPLGAILSIPRSVIGNPAQRPYEPSKSSIIAKGLRNPWRISRDPETDRLWIGDVGEATWEEVNVIEDVSTSDSVANFGWPAFEGTERTSQPGTMLESSDPLRPVHRSKHDSGVCAVVGGYVARGSAVPALQGTYLFGDNCGTTVLGIDAAVAVDAATSTDATVLGEVGGGIVSFGEDTKRTLYVLANDGSVYRVDPGNWHVPSVSSKSPPDSTTTTADLAPPTSAECELPAAFSALAEYPSMTPQEAEAATTQLLDLLDRLVDEAAPERREAVMTVLAAITDLSKTAAAAEWKFDDERVTAEIKAIQSGTRPYEEVPAAISAAVASTNQCP